MELTLSLTLDNGAIQLFWTYFIRFFVFVNGMRLDRLHEMYRPCLVNGNTPGGAEFFVRQVVFLQESARITGNNWAVKTENFPPLAVLTF